MQRCYAYIMSIKSVCVIASPSLSYLEKNVITRRVWATGFIYSEIKLWCMCMREGVNIFYGIDLFASFDSFSERARRDG